jgi:aryl-phospho-beta-D-glucosidase BglC (GH1 family)
MKPILALFALAVVLQRAEFPAQADSADINKRLGRGINMGNMLEAPAEGEWGPKLDEHCFAVIANKGFTSVRIPIRWSGPGRLEQESPYRITPAFFQRVDRAVDAALAAKLAVVINFHHYDELIADPEGEHDRFLAAWRQVSEHFRSYPDGLVFEILNEPNGKLTPDKWNALLLEALATIRKTNPRRTVIVGGAGWSGVGSLSSLKLPENDKHLILTVHYYNPFHFTHQGAAWVGKQSQAWLGTAWEGSCAEKLSVLNELRTVREFADAAGIPVYIGEFGAYSKADMASRVRWTSYCARLFEKLGFSWSYWEFCAGFGAYDPEKQAWREDLAGALISDDTSVLKFGQPPTHVDSRTNIVLNGDFAEGQKHWTFGAWHGKAAGSVENAVLTVRITDPSEASWHIQLLQDGLTYYDGNVYEVTFEAWADQERTIVVGAENSKDYATFGSMTVQLSSSPKRFTFRFVKVGDDDHGRVSFSFGAQAAPVHLRSVRINPSRRLFLQSEEGGGLK